jgi:hypothetical protein
MTIGFDQADRREIAAYREQAVGFRFGQSGVGEVGVRIWI